MSLEQRDHLLAEKARSYQTAAVATGVWTGAGGLLLGLADFPILLGIKIKFLFDASSLYGFDSHNYKERLFILHIFQLAFSSPEQRAKTYLHIRNWPEYSRSLPENINDFDWRTFQQEYRDYIDLAKMLQLVPGIGAIVGGVANHKLMKRLEETTRNAYRLRFLNTTSL